MKGVMSAKNDFWMWNDISNEVDVTFPKGNPLLLFLLMGSLVLIFSSCFAPQRDFGLIYVIQCLF